MIIDTHCHLDKGDYDNLESVIMNMSNDIMIASGADPKDNKNVIDLVNNYKNIYGTIGIHPEFANTYTEDDLKFIEDNLSNPKIVGIGEIGLDYHWVSDNKEEQKQLFISQIRLAKKYNKTIVIHSRDAASDTLDILKQEYDGKLKINMHCYSYSIETAKELLKMNVKFGIGGVITFKNSKKIKEVVDYLSLSDIVLETDSPYLTPEPYRGKKNNPKNVYIVAEKIAELKDKNIEIVINTTTKTALSQFDLSL
jgi:TatD DNase family protein